jgi:hypothetical protein
MRMKVLFVRDHQFIFTPWLIDSSDSQTAGPPSTTRLGAECSRAKLALGPSRQLSLLSLSCLSLHPDQVEVWKQQVLFCPLWVHSDGPHHPAAAVIPSATSSSTQGSSRTQARLELVTACSTRSSWTQRQTSPDTSTMGCLCFAGGKSPFDRR